MGNLGERKKDQKNRPPSAIQTDVRASAQATVGKWGLPRVWVG
jgi:hypothetical protein